MNMAALSDFLEAKLAQLLFKNNSGTFATPGDQLWVALFTSDAGLEAGVITSEVAGGSYARQQVAAAGWTQTGGAVENTADINFPQATASWGTVSHVAIMSANAAGDVLFHGALATPRAVGNGDQFKINAGDLDVVFA
jgi:hypothetical protein